MSLVDVFRGFVTKRVALAHRYFLILDVQVEADELVEELRRRRDGLAPRTLDLPMLRAALDTVAPVQPSAEDGGKPRRERGSFDSP